MSAGTPYTSGPHIIEVEGGQETCIQLRTPHRGRIVAIKMEQLAGADVACDFELFTSIKACPPGNSLSSESLSESVEGPRSAYSVFGTKQMIAGTPVHENEHEYYFTNQDGTPTNPQRHLYLAMRPEGSGIKQFALTMEMTVSMLG